jgi:uncharacterized membrane protein
MADNHEEVLRRSLDAVDRHRNRLLIGLAGTVALLLFVFFRGATAMHSGNSNTAQAILAHYFILVIWVTALTLVVVIQITVMTKRILRAIELASKK